MADIKGWVKGGWVLSVHLVSNEVRAEAANPIIRPPLSLFSPPPPSVFLSPPFFNATSFSPHSLSIYLLSIYPSRSRYVDAAVPFISFCSNSVESTEICFILAFVIFVFFVPFGFSVVSSSSRKVKRSNSYKANIIRADLSAI